MMWQRPYVHMVKWHMMMWQFHIGIFGRMVLRHVVDCGWLYSATWPSHGPPCGTILLVARLKLLESIGFDPMTSTLM
jgi:hypothetical protein